MTETTSTLRVGGPCMVKQHGRPDWRGAAGDVYAPNMMHVTLPSGKVICAAVHTVTPCPFIPGDVVTHPDKPGLRGLIDETDMTGSGAVVRVRWSDGFMTRHYDVGDTPRDRHLISLLTLILPAQEVA